MNNRRKLLVALGAGALIAPFGSFAQQPAKVYRIGFLSSASAAGFARQGEALRAGLHELGYVEGKNLVIDFRWAEGQFDRLPELAAELAHLKVDLIVALYTAAAQAAKQATSTIPIVIVNAGDPVAVGLVASLARPGGNVTGLSAQGREVMGKRLQLLTEAFPRLSRVAVLWNPATPIQHLLWKEVQVAAPALGVKLQSVEVRDHSEFEAAFPKMIKGRAGAFVATLDPLFVNHRRQMVELAARTRIPAMYSERDFAEDGGLMAYGVDTSDQLRRAAVYVEKIFKGAKPAELPVEQPTRFELVINRKTFKALGLVIPQELLLRADKVIE